MDPGLRGLIQDHRIPIVGEYPNEMVQLDRTLIGMNRNSFLTGRTTCYRIILFSKGVL